VDAAVESDLIAVLRFNLFTYRDLIEWLNHSFETPSGLPDGGQLVWSTLGHGQQDGPAHENCLLRCQSPC
jgi:hypothetical protein